MNNKQQIAKWRLLSNPSLGFKTHQITHDMLDMLEQQQAEIDRLTKDNQRLENEVEEWVYVSMGEDV